jgi:hypothetical protein
MKLQIGGLEFTPEPFTDGDLIYLTSALGNMGDIPRDVAERNASLTLRDIFPTMPPDWTKGDRLRPPLHRTTLAVVCKQLQEILMSQDEYQDTLDPLKSLPIGDEVTGQITQLQQSHRRTQNNQPKKRSQYRH